MQPNLRGKSKVPAALRANDRMTLKEYVERDATCRRRLPPLLERMNHRPSPTGVPSQKVSPRKPRPQCGHNRSALIGGWKAPQLYLPTNYLSSEDYNTRRRFLGSRVAEYMSGVPDQPTKKLWVQPAPSTEPSTLLNPETSFHRTKDYSVERDTSTSRFELSPQQIEEVKQLLSPTRRRTKRDVVVYNNVQQEGQYGELPESSSAILGEEDKGPALAGSKTAATPLAPKEAQAIMNTTANSRGVATLDWARSILFWNVKNGQLNFNSEKDAEVYYDFEVEFTAATLRQKREEIGVIEATRPFHAKARCTMKRLATELMNGHTFYNIDSRCMEVSASSGIR